MNYRIIFHMAGRVLLAEAGLLVLPLAVSLLYREDCAWAVLAPWPWPPFWAGC